MTAKPTMGESLLTWDVRSSGRESTVELQYGVAVDAASSFEMFGRGPGVDSPQPLRARVICMPVVGAGSACYLIVPCSVSFSSRPRLRAPRNPQHAPAFSSSGPPTGLMRRTREAA